MARVICEHLSHILEAWRQEEQDWGTVILQNEPKEKPAKGDEEKPREQGVHETKKQSVISKSGLFSQSC